MALGLLDRCCSAETMMRFPAIYKMSQNRSDFNIKVTHTHKQNFDRFSFFCKGLLDLVFKCSLSFDYSLFYVLCNVKTR